MENSSPSSGEIADFYDVFSDRLLRDYVRGNLRFERALRFVKDCVSRQAKSILDIGCGAGISAKELKTQYPEMQVTAIDISPRNISIAKALFHDANVKYCVSNLTDGVIDGRFDLIVMIDVHEHVPRLDWAAFHDALAERLTERGSLVLTFPSVRFQQYLQSHNPKGLQVVDESISMEDIVALAARIRGEVKVYRHVNVYRTGDYVHVMISRSDEFDRIPVDSINLRTFFPKAGKLLRRVRRGYAARRRLATHQTQPGTSGDASKHV